MPTKTEQAQATRGHFALPEVRDHLISLAEAVDLTLRHQREHADEGHGSFFFREAFDTILGQAGCVALRIYRGKDSAGAHAFVLVGVNAQGRDMAAEALREYGMPCPPYCDASSPLVGAKVSSIRQRKGPGLPEPKSHVIGLAEAKDLVFRHRADHPDQPRAGLFHRASLDTLLAQAGCVGARIYRGKSTDERRHFVLVGVNGEGFDLVDGVVMEREYPCPPYCDIESPFVG